MAINGYWLNPGGDAADNKAEDGARKPPPPGKARCAMQGIDTTMGLNPPGVFAFRMSVTPPSSVASLGSRSAAQNSAGQQVSLETANPQQGGDRASRVNMNQGGFELLA